MRTDFRFAAVLMAALVLLPLRNAQAQNLSGPVQAGTSPEQWLDSLRDANDGKWNETDSVSGPMYQILEKAAYAMAEEGNRGTPCRRAAANLGHAVLFDAYTWAAGMAVPTAAYNAIGNILSLGEKGVVDFLKEKFKEGAKKEIEDFIKGKLSTQKPEVYVSRTTKSGCDVVLVAIWDKAAGTYQVSVYGDCQCKVQPIFMGGSIQMRTFAVQLSGRVTVSIDSTTIAPVLYVGVPTRKSIEANCACSKPRTPIDPPPPPEDHDKPKPPEEADKPPPPEEPDKPQPPEDPDTPQPPKPDRPRTGSEPPPAPPICTPCEPHQRAVEALKAELAPIDRQLESLAAQLDANRAEQQKLQTRIKSLQGYIKSQVGSGGSGYDPDTGSTTSSYTQPDGSVLVTTTDASGKVVDQHSRERRDIEGAKRDLDAANAELQALQAKATNLQNEREQLQNTRKETTKKLAEAEAALEDCLKKCRLAAAENQPRQPRMIQDFAGLNTGSQNPLFQNMILDRVAPLVSRVAARIDDPSSVWSMFRRLMPRMPGSSAMAHRSSLRAPARSVIRPGDIIALSNTPSQSGGAREIAISLIATGGSSGDVFRIHGVDRFGVPISLGAAEGLVLQPLKQQIEAAKSAAQNAIPGQSATAYCLDFVKLPPSAGTLYRVADPRFQEQFAPMARVLQAARRLAENGGLHPDSNPAGYATSIKQWSLWSRIQKWDVAGFERHFLEYTKKAALEAGRPWTKELEQRVRGLVPNRWRDISAVWAAADSAEQPGQ